MAAAAAVVLSLLIHVTLFEKIPPFKMGHPELDQETTRFRPFELDKNPVVLPSSVKEPARFRPENPDQLREVFGEPEIAAQVKAADLPVPDAPQLPVGPMTAQDRALVAPALPTTRTPWEPRQDIVQVEEQIYAENVSALPRRYVEKVERSEVAPDIVFAAEPADITAAGGFGSGDERGELSVSRPLMGEEIEGGGAGAAKDVEAPPESLFPGETTAFDEEKKDITEFKPAEQYLALDVLTFKSPDEPGATYFEVHLARQGEQTLPVLPKDVLFLQDCSESMTAWKLAECKTGLRRWLDQLHPGDRFELLGFRDAAFRCFNGWADFNDANKTRALKFIDDMRAVGNTDVYASLNAAQGMERDPSRPLLAILVTDGRPTVGTTDSSDIIEAFTQANRGNVSVFSFGAGRRVNRFLLDLLSYRNRGDSMVIVDTDRIPSTMQSWARETSRPVLSDLTYQFTGLDESQVFPSTLTHLYLDRPLVIYGRMNETPDKTAFQVVGHSGSEVRDMVFQLDLDTARAGDEAMRVRWVWHRIYDLIGRYIQSRQPAVLAEINTLAQRFRLDVPYTRELSEHRGPEFPTDPIPAQ